jgi:RimJ/RimL family protein N-acetyltransferase
MTTGSLAIELTLSSDHRQLRVRRNDQSWQARLGRDGTEVRIRAWEGPVLDGSTGPQLLDSLFHTLAASRLVLTGNAAAAFDTRHPAWWHRDAEATLERAAFYQIREHWLAPELWPVMPDLPDRTGEVSHPRRPAIGDQILYRRHVPALGRTVTLRQATVQQDGERFHRWQNEPRVARFWEYPWSRPELDALLAECRADPHCLPLILEADGQAVGYFEAYYVVEDRLGPYCDAGPFDQGFHVLVGEPEFLGRGQAPHWLNAVSHCLFLMEPRTQALWGEPRADNQAMLRHTRTTTWEKLREFDFPHKRAALLRNQRHRFFQQTQL